MEIRDDAGPSPGSQPGRGDSVERVASWLRSAIVEGRLPPGARLRQQEIASACRTSRMPVRDALRLLESEGLVTLVPNAGAAVASFDLDELLEIYQLRERVEPLALALSVPSLSIDDIDALDAYQRELTGAAHAGDVARWVTVDRDFHLRMLSRAPARFTELIEAWWNGTQHFRRTYLELPGAARTALVEHELLLGAVRARQSDDAGQALELHIRRTRRTLAERAAVRSVERPPGVQGASDATIGQTGSWSRR